MLRYSIVTGTFSSFKDDGRWQSTHLSWSNIVDYTSVPRSSLNSSMFNDSWTTIWSTWPHVIACLNLLFDNSGTVRLHICVRKYNYNSINLCKMILHNFSKNLNFKNIFESHIFLKCYIINIVFTYLYVYLWY